MGYLHEGHLALVRKARELADVVVASIFVNPRQFGPNEDLSRYPRDFERDRTLLEWERTDMHLLSRRPGDVPGGILHLRGGRRAGGPPVRPFEKGPLQGVATVVAKLFNAVKPHFAVFGQKDYQQLKIIERMVKDLNMDIEIVGHPTVREEGGLAMSSRNAYLSADEREKALLIHASIKKVEELFRSGERKSRAAGGGGPQSADVERRHGHRVCCRVRP